jgi:hypothetical protein
MFWWWVGSWPTAPTPNLGDQDFLSGLYPLAFGVPTPLLQGNKICNPTQGPLQAAISRSQPNPVFFFWGCYSSPSSFLNRAWDRLWRRIILRSLCLQCNTFFCKSESWWLNSLLFPRPRAPLCRPPSPISGTRPAGWETLFYRTLHDSTELVE